LLAGDHGQGAGETDYRDEADIKLLATMDINNAA